MYARKSLFSLVLAAAVALGASPAGFKAGKAELKSAGPLAFGPDGILFIADTLGGSVVAIDTGDTARNAAGAKIEVKGLADQIASLAGGGVKPDQLLVNDMAVNPNSKTVYLSVSLGRGPDALPALVKIDKTGKLSMVSLDNVKHSMVKLADAAEGTDARGNNRRMESITDLAFVDGKVIVAGLSNEEFSSNLRAIPFPFETAAKGASIEIYHGQHGRFETNSPIRTFVPYKIGNESHILAAYTCTPLVKIPVSQLKAGNKVKGTTIAELGNRNRPLDMIVYSKGGKNYLMMANSSRGVMKMPADGLEKYEPITAQTEKQGVPYETLKELTGVQQLDKIDDGNALILVSESGSMELRTIPLS